MLYNIEKIFANVKNYIVLCFKFNLKYKKMKTQIYKEIAKKCEWLKTVNEHHLAQCESNLDYLEDLLPSGSGIDSGCTIDREKSGSKKIIISFSYHHMDENGMYCGWTDHDLIVTPNLTDGFDLRITGKNKRQIKEYLYDVFYHAMNEPIDPVY